MGLRALPAEREARHRRRRDAPCVVLAVGARDKSVDNPDWGGYTVDEAALRHGAGVEEETTEPEEAYAGLTRRQPTPYSPEWLGQDS